VGLFHSYQSSGGAAKWAFVETKTKESSAKCEPILAGQNLPFET
jgi:hypothetical protein